MTATEQKVRAASYCRYSSSNQREESNEAQFRVITEYAKKNKIKIVETYFDQELTGTNDDRASFQRMIKDSELDLFDVILVYQLTRFARNKYDSGFYKKRLRELGIKVISVTENIDGSPESVILESMLEGMSEYFSRDLSRSVRRGLRENALSCRATGGRPAYGYDYTHDKHYVINEYEAGAVKRVFEDYIKGVPYREIADWLNRSGYRTKNGTEFKFNSIHYLLKNEKYAGIYIYNMEKRNKYDEPAEPLVIENGVPAIITKEQFDIVQSRLRINKDRSQMYRAKILYILSGKLQCAECGNKLFGNSRKNKGRNLWAGYLCVGRRKKICNLKEHKKENLEELVLNHLEKEIFNDDNIEHMAEMILEAYKKQKDTRYSEVDEYAAKLKDVKKQITNIIQAIASGVSSPTLINKLGELELIKSDLEINIAQLEIKANNEYSPEDVIKYLSLGKGISTKSTIEQIRIIDQFVDKIIVGDNTVSIEYFIEPKKKKGSESTGITLTSHFSV